MSFINMKQSFNKLLTSWIEITTTNYATPVASPLINKYMIQANTWSIRVIPRNPNTEVTKAT